MPRLEDIHIASSPLTDRVYIGTRSKKSPGVWSQKHDCTSVFIGALMGWCEPGTVRIVTDNHGGRYEIEVRKVETAKGADHA